MTTIAAQHELRKRWILPAQGLIVLTLCALLASWTWHAAGDPMVDSARDLYAAQRMAAGDAL